MRKYILILLVVLFTVNCSDHDSNDQEWGLSISVGVEIHVYNEDGVNLLDQSNPEAYPWQGVYTYYKDLTDGKWKLNLSSTADASRGFLLLDNDGVTAIPPCMYFYGFVVQKTGVWDESAGIQIRWNENDIDTIKQGIYRDENGGLHCMKVWLNDELVWDAYGGDGVDNYRQITIIKKK